MVPTSTGVLPVPITQAKAKNLTSLKKGLACWPLCAPNVCLGVERNGGAHERWSSLEIHSSNRCRRPRLQLSTSRSPFLGYAHGPARDAESVEPAT
jgi:hypothetical protein